MKVGSLYQINDCFWFIFSCREDAVLAEEFGVSSGPSGWYLNNGPTQGHVSIFPVDVVFMLLKQDGDFCEILCTDGQRGWIRGTKEYLEGFIPLEEKANSL